MTVLHKLDDISHYGVKLLYCDTDSVIFKCPKRHREWILSEEILDVKNGVLGHLKVEKPDQTILQYVSGGAKQYALKV